MLHVTEKASMRSSSTRAFTLLLSGFLSSLLCVWVGLHCRFFVRLVPLLTARDQTATTGAICFLICIPGRGCISSQEYQTRILIFTLIGSSLSPELSGLGLGWPCQERWDCCDDLKWTWSWGPGSPLMPQWEHRIDTIEIITRSITVTEKNPKQQRPQTWNCLCN